MVTVTAMVMAMLAHHTVNPVAMAVHLMAIAIVTVAHHTVSPVAMAVHLMAMAMVTVAHHTETITTMARLILSQAMARHSVFNLQANTQHTIQKNLICLNADQVRSIKTT